jgi:putative oxidoreductase
MKIAAHIARVLLGLMFTLFGVNAFFPFIPMSGPMPTGHAGEFIGALMGSHYMHGVAAVEVIGGVLLLIGTRFAPLGLLMIGPVVVNIAFYHIFLAPQGSGPAVVVCVLSLFLLYCYRNAFAGLVRASHSFEI